MATRSDPDIRDPCLGGHGRTAGNRVAGRPRLGVAAGATLGSRPWARRIARSAGLGGGAAGVAALMGLPLVGLVFILELGRRRRVPITLERVLGAGAGAAVGWFVNVTFELDFIRLAVPRMPPGSLSKVIVISMVVGVASGAVGHDHRHSYLRRPRLGVQTAS